MKPETLDLHCTVAVFCKTLFFVLAEGLAQYAGPILIRMTINYIEDGDRDLQTGILLVCGVVVARVLVSIFSAQIWINFVSL